MLLADIKWPCTYSRHETNKPGSTTLDTLTSKSVSERGPWQKERTILILSSETQPHSESISLAYWTNESSQKQTPEVSCGRFFVHMVVQIVYYNDKIKHKNPQWRASSWQTLNGLVRILGTRPTSRAHSTRHINIKECPRDRPLSPWQKERTILIRSSETQSHS